MLRRRSTRASIRSSTHSEDEQQSSIPVLSESQDENKPSDGHTGVSQDFYDMCNSPMVLSSPVAASRGSAKFQQAPAPKLMPPPRTRYARRSAAATSPKATSPNVSSPKAMSPSSSAASFASEATPVTSAFKSKGIVCVVKRPSAISKKKDIKTYALQNTFYAYPLDATNETRDKILSKIKEVSDNFEFQKYETKICEFELPFEVEEICKISTGYSTVPKRHKIKNNTGKRKRAKISSSSSEEDNVEDMDIEPDEPPVEVRTKRRR